MKPQRSKPTQSGSLMNKLSNLLYETGSAVNYLLPCFNILSLCSTPDFTDSARAFFDFFNEEIIIPNRILIVWHVRHLQSIKEVYEKYYHHNCRVLFVKKNSLISFLLFCLSKYIVDTHGLYSMVKLKNRQRSIYLTHGMPVKKFGFEYDNDIQLGVQHADFALATSPFYQDVIARSMGIMKDHVYPIGLPRNDVFFKTDHNELIIRELLSSRYVIYLPTYRISNDHNKDNGVDLCSEDRLLGGNREEWVVLNRKLEAQRTKMVIKPHPLEKHNNVDVLKTLSQVFVIDDNWIIQHNLSLNTILKYSSSLITDYSGAFIDYLLNDKPIIFFMPDYTAYKESRGYVIDNYIDVLPGALVTRLADIGDLLGKDEYKAARREARELYNNQTKPDAAKDVYRILFELK